jgi:hypothetical protein
MLFITGTPTPDLRPITCRYFIVAISPTAVPYQMPSPGLRISFRAFYSQYLMPLTPSHFYRYISLFAEYFILPYQLLFNTNFASS